VEHSENIEERSGNILGENLETVERYPLPPTADYHLLCRQTTHTHSSYTRCSFRNVNCVILRMLAWSVRKVVLSCVRSHDISLNFLERVS
jgi:hypothetical protein